MCQKKEVEIRPLGTICRKKVKLKRIRDPRKTKTIVNKLRPGNRHRDADGKLVFDITKVVI